MTPLIVASAAVFGAKLRKLSTEVQDQLADSSALAEEALSNARIVKAFTREFFEIERYRYQIERTFQIAMRMTRIRSAFGPLITFLAFSSLTLILWFGGREVLADRLSAGALIAFLVYGINIAGSIGTFTSLYTQIQEAAGASRRIFEIIDERSEIIEIPNAQILPAVLGKITFSGVSFAYPGARHVLHNIDLEIQPGEVLALVGPSGAGKSTLFNLIPRFYDPTSGKVCLDGYDLRDVSLSSLRMQIGLVPQETQLFSGTVLENVRYGKLDATDEELETAVRSANADEFIHNLPNGFETLVGERGVKLSGGQRQRIAIARAILRIRIFCCSMKQLPALTLNLKVWFRKRWNILMLNRTTVIIAHRLSTIQKANRIAVLDQGKLIELGTHSGLIEQDGLYSRLYKLQFQEAMISLEE